jgi:hypothetical protein
VKIKDNYLLVESYSIAVFRGVGSSSSNDPSLRDMMDLARQWWELYSRNTVPSAPDPKVDTLFFRTLTAGQVHFTAATILNAVALISFELRAPDSIFGREDGNQCAATEL